MPSFEEVALAAKDDTIRRQPTLLAQEQSGRELEATQYAIEALTRDKTAQEADLARKTKALERVLKQGVPIYSENFTLEDTGLSTESENANSAELALVDRTLRFPTEMPVRALQKRATFSQFCPVMAEVILAILHLGTHLHRALWGKQRPRSVYNKQLRDYCSKRTRSGPAKLHWGIHLLPQ